MRSPLVRLWRIPFLLNWVERIKSTKNYASFNKLNLHADITVIQISDWIELGWMYEYSSWIVYWIEMTGLLDFWDTAGQERFHSLHPSYYHQAHCAILIFDAARKITYKNLTKWYDELRQFRPEIPCLVAVNKIDGNPCRSFYPVGLH